jgi:thiamine kinase-like enzyme
VQFKDEALRVLRSLNYYSADDLAQVSLERLGGQTNKVYMVTSPRGRHVLRIPGKGTEEYINRGVEVVAARAASKAEISPKLIVSLENGVLLSEAIEAGETMTPAKFNESPAKVKRAAETLRALHCSGATFDFRFELFSMIDEYLKVLGTKDVNLPEGYHRALDAAESVRQALNARPLPLAPCHCDPLAENFIDTPARMWMVDWEYSGMNDPLWDLGDFAVEAELTRDNEILLIASYFQTEPTPAELGRYVIYKAMCDLLWTIWGLIQLANKNPAEDFQAYALRRFGRCRALMESNDFVDHLQNVSVGNPP